MAETKPKGSIAVFLQQAQASVLCAAQTFGIDAWVILG